MAQLMPTRLPRPSDNLGVLRAAALACVVACSDRAAGGAEGDESSAHGETGDVGDTDDELSPACAAALDPQRYPDHAVVTPPPVVASAECPALDGPLVIDLPEPVLVTGVLEADGQPVPGTVYLHGRDGEGDVTRYVGGDGSFAAEVIPGRYDVSAEPHDGDIHRRIEVLEDVDLTGPSALVLPVPAAVTLSGTMTMDGEPAPDPFGFVQIRADGESDRKLFHMLDGAFELEVTPGTYVFEYLWCDYSDPSSSDCSEWDGPPIPEDAPRIGPQQNSTSFMSLAIEADSVVLLDVPTIQLTGSVELIDGELDDMTQLRLRHGYWTDYSLAQDGSFALRLVRRDYETLIAPDGAPVPEIAQLDADTHVEIVRQAALVTAKLPPSLPVVSGWLSLELTRLDSQQRNTLLTEFGDIGLSESVWAGAREVWFGASYCWPDHVDGATWVTTMLSPAIEFSGPTEIDLEVPVAAVHIDLAELGEHPIHHNDGETIEFEPVDDSPTGRLQLIRPPGESSLDIHGYMAPGHYRVTYADSLLGTFEIVDGSTLRLHLNTRHVEVQLRAGEQPLALSSPWPRLDLHNVDTRVSIDYADHPEDLGQQTYAPGRYELIYHGRHELGDAAPDNRNAVVGCLTVEG